MDTIEYSTEDQLSVVRHQIDGLFWEQLRYRACLIRIEDELKQKEPDLKRIQELVHLTLSEKAFESLCTWTDLND